MIVFIELIKHQYSWIHQINMHIIIRALSILLFLFGTITAQNSKDNKASCDECNVQMQGLIDVINLNSTREQIVEKYEEICINYSKQKPESCEGLAQRNVDIMIFVVREKYSTATPVTAEAICYFENHPSCPLTDASFDWQLDLNFLGSKPGFEVPQLPSDGAPSIEILQITDLHLDPTYTPGNNALCGLPSCCRASQGAAPNSTAAAGFWGDYRNCDMPVHAFQNLLDQCVSAHPDISYVMFTGDVIDHANWLRTAESNTADFQLAMNMFKEAYPDKLVFPIFGNHESIPANRVAPPDWLEVPANLTNQWLFQVAADIWGKWLPGTTDTILRGGFYSYVVNPSLKIIALNNNFCYTNNWWLLYKNFDPSGQLIWLAEELLAAEKNGQKVHILAHIPVGSSTAWSVCSREYRRIIDRFQNTVVAQFHGHTHRDHFNIYYDLDEPSRATGVSFVGGSATSYRNYNPNYRVYQVDGGYDGASYMILDHSTWFYNLTEANLAGSDVLPNWQKLYSFKEAYGLESMLPHDLDQLVHSMAQNATLQQLYHRFYVTAGDPSLEAGCDEGCLHKIVCDIVKTVATDDCNQLPFNKKSN